MLRIKVARKLRDFTLDVDIAAGPGETLVLMGNNGSGKTTVLNLVAGLMSPDTGVIGVDGRTLFSSGAGVDLPPEQRNVGYVFQNYALFPHMTVFDNVAFGLRMRKISQAEAKARVRPELESLGLWELRDEKAVKLSGGQKQRVALARALVVQPSLMLLDEPLSALDREIHDSIRESLRKRLKSDRITSIVALHNDSDALALGQTMCVLDRGRVLQSGTPAEVLGRPGDLTQ
jgi:molybdate transport system ATP-binding protein